MFFFRLVFNRSHLKKNEIKRDAGPSVHKTWLMDWLIVPRDRNVEQTAIVPRDI